MFECENSVGENQARDKLVNGCIVRIRPGSAFAHLLSTHQPIFHA